MKKTTPRLILCGVLLAGILAFIWGNSAMPGEASGELSGWIGELLCKLLPFLSLESEEGMHLLRKAAHFSEFAALGFCFGWLWGMLTEMKSHQYLLSRICGLAAACIDETIQIFSPGRYASVTDVFIDSCGVLAGVCFLFLCLSLITYIRKKAAAN